MTIHYEEIRDILDYLEKHGIIKTAHYFRRHRDTIRKLCRKNGIYPPKEKPGRKTKELKMCELNERWEKQDKCDHNFYKIVCSTCGKILGSESKKV